jgi:hypothetical protein
LIDFSAEFAVSIFRVKEYYDYQGALASLRQQSVCARVTVHNGIRNSLHSLNPSLLLIAAYCRKGKLHSRIYRIGGRKETNTLPLRRHRHRIVPSAKFVHSCTGQKFCDSCTITVPATAAIEASVDFPLLPDLRRRKSFLQTEAS